MSTPADSFAWRAVFVLATVALLAALAWGVSAAVDEMRQPSEPIAATPAPAASTAVTPAPPPPAPSERIETAYRQATERLDRDLREAEEPVRVGGKVLPPRRLSGDSPAYTEAARRARVQGVVVLEATIDREGRVTSTRILKDLPIGLGDKAREAVSTWRFAPATRGGEPVACYFTISVNFQLE